MSHTHLWYTGTVVLGKAEITRDWCVDCGEPRPTPTEETPCTPVTQPPE